MLTRDDLEDESQEAEICRFLLNAETQKKCIAKRKMMELKTTQTLNMARNFQSFQIFVTGISLHHFFLVGSSSESPSHVQDFPSKLTA